MWYIAIGLLFEIVSNDSFVVVKALNAGQRDLLINSTHTQKSDGSSLWTVLQLISIYNIRKDVYVFGTNDYVVMYLKYL